MTLMLWLVLWPVSCAAESFIAEKTNQLNGSPFNKDGSLMCIMRFVIYLAGICKFWHAV